MSLIKATLQEKLLELVGNSENFPDTYAQSALNFGNAINAYGSLVIPVSTTSITALSTFVSTFIASKSKESIEILVDAVVSYCSSLALGMTSAGFVGNPPPSSFVLKTSLLLASQIARQGGSAEDWANSASIAIDSYFKTGTATNIETGVIVPWT